MFSLCLIESVHLPSQGQTVTSHPDQGCAQASLPGHAHGDGCQRQQPGVGDEG